MSMAEEIDDDSSAPDVIGSVRTPYDDWVDAVYAGLGDIDKLILMHKTGYRNADVLTPAEIAQKTGISPDAVLARTKRIQAQLDSFRQR